MLRVSRTGAGTGQAFHDWTLRRLTAEDARRDDPSRTALARRWCHDAFVSDFLAAFGAENVLVLETETLRAHRDAVLHEIQTFLGLEPEPTQLPVMAVCKRDRYKGDFEGCYNGTSKVRPETRDLWRPFFSDCNRNLEALLGLKPGSLYAGASVRKRRPADAEPQLAQLR